MDLKVKLERLAVHWAGTNWDTVEFYDIVYIIIPQSQQYMTNELQQQHNRQMCIFQGIFGFAHL